MWTYGKVKVHWLGHDSFVLEGSKAVVIIDPYQARGNFKADLLLLSHEHSDHMNPDDIRRFTTPSTKVVAPRVCESGLSGFGLEKKFVSANSKVELQGVVIETLPAYNLNKFRSPGRVFHPKQDGRGGYLLTLTETSSTPPGDPVPTPELKPLRLNV